MFKAWFDMDIEKNEKKNELRPKYGMDAMNPQSGYHKREDFLFSSFWLVH